MPLNKLSFSRYNVITERANPGLVWVLPVRPWANPRSSRDERMPAVQRQRISGHSPYEPVFGFSRAVVAGLLDPAWLVEIEAEAVLPGR